MNAIEAQMLGLFEVEAIKVAKPYCIRVDIDWEKFTVNFVTEKELTQEQLNSFLVDMTAALQKFPIFKKIRGV